MSHLEHGNGFSPVWNLLCTLKCAISWKTLSHWEHLNFFLLCEPFHVHFWLIHIKNQTRKFCKISAPSKSPTPTESKMSWIWSFCYLHTWLSIKFFLAFYPQFQVVKSGVQVLNHPSSKRKKYIHCVDIVYYINV